MPRGVRLTFYGGEANDLPQRVLQEFLAGVAARDAVVPMDHVYGFDQVAEAHAAMEADHATGKLVVVTCPRASSSGRGRPRHVLGAGSTPSSCSCRPRDRHVAE